MVREDVELLASYWMIAGGAEPHTDREYSPLNFKDRVAAAARGGLQRGGNQACQSGARSAEKKSGGDEENSRR